VSPQALAVTGSPRASLNRRALDPARSVVVAACAGSGKTWLLVARSVRLLLAGVAPGDILAITFTRKAAQEMAARLRVWLEALAGADDAGLRKLLHDLELPEPEIETLLPVARGLHERLLTAQTCGTLRRSKRPWVRWSPRRAASTSS